MGKTVAEVRAWIAKNAERGVRCPCCHGYCKVYPIHFVSQMAYTLIWMVRVFERNQRWINIPKEAPKNIIGSRCYDKLTLWGLVEIKENTNTKKRTSGIWRPTQKGIDFVHRKITVSAVTYEYRGMIITASARQVDVVETLKKKWDYQELMNPNYQWV